MDWIDFVLWAAVAACLVALIYLGILQRRLTLENEMRATQLEVERHVRHLQQMQMLGIRRKNK